MKTMHFQYNSPSFGDVAIMAKAPDSEYSVSSAITKESTGTFAIFKVKKVAGTQLLDAYVIEQAKKMLPILSEECTKKISIAHQLRDKAYQNQADYSKQLMKHMSPEQYIEFTQNDPKHIALRNETHMYEEVCFTYWQMHMVMDSWKLVHYNEI